MSQYSNRVTRRGNVPSCLSRHFARSTLALGVTLALAAGSLHAQEANQTSSQSDETTELDTVVVKGVRGSVIRAQEIKQEAEQIIDSVTAEDIGAMPDRSVTETIKRISGVTVTNFAARNDTDHFSAEGSGVMIRGLTFVRGELNGRDVFSANGGRGISFEEVSAELMAGVDVYKNPSAEIIEGGLGGTVNLRTRKPFDEPGRKIAGSIDYNYGDKAKEGKPSASFLFSDRWQTGIGEIGFLANLSYSELATRSDGIQVQPFHRRGRMPAEQPEGGPNDWYYDWELNSWQPAESQRDALLAGTDFEQVFIPGGVNWRRTDFDRKRQGGALAFQWRPNDDTEVYLQAITAKYDLTWREHFMECCGSMEKNNDEMWSGDPNQYQPVWQDGLADKTNNVVPMPGTQFVYDENGRFIKGTLRQGGWRGQPGDGPANMYQRPGIQFAAGNRYNTQSSQTTDWSAGFRHFITDNFVVRGDFQYVKSTSDNVDFSVHTSTLLDQVTLDLSGKYPSLTIGEPLTAQEQNRYFWRSAMDHIAENEGTERAGRVDFEVTFDDSDWLRFFRFGARVADRHYSSLSTGWNWAPISDDWRRIANPPDPNRPPVAWLDQFFPAESMLYSMSDFFGGNVNVPTQFWTARDALVTRENVLATLSTIPSTGETWSPVDYGPETTNLQDERTQAGYGILYFENEDRLGVPVDGNIGVRVVKTSVKNVGGGLMPDMGNWGSNVVAPEVLAAFTGQAFHSTSSTTYTDVLPSLNLRVRFDHGLQWRFAASKAIARPEFRLMQPWLTLRADASACNRALQDDLRTELCGFDDLSYSGSGGNPELKPMRANQFDTALEWYFGQGNSAYITLFSKDVKDYFVNGTSIVNIEGRNYEISRTRNLDEGKIRGFEVGYSQFFKFLPGFGIQANYTFVDSKGGSNTAVNSGEMPLPGTIPLELPLEGLSKRSYNVQGIYERGPVQLRLAYNWRSRYLLTSNDVADAMGIPVWNDDYGQLDGSFFYNINKNIQIGVQANNLTNSVTKLLMGPRGYRRDGYVDETLYNRAWFENDRRYSAVLRAKW